MLTLDERQPPRAAEVKPPEGTLGCSARGSRTEDGSVVDTNRRDGFVVDWQQRPTP
jgi:hypothetical protein